MGDFIRTILNYIGLTFTEAMMILGIITAMAFVFRKERSDKNV
jgi:F0F1-type ATP synthase membrane subunit c/vacuolar-type H+-ATPase subunit K